VCVPIFAIFGILETHFDTVDLNCLQFLKPSFKKKKKNYKLISCRV
jgi:hypothetical protein